MKKGIFWFVVYLIFGLYLINKGIIYYNFSDLIPENIDRIIILIGGILVLLGGFNHFRVSSRQVKHR